MKNLEKKGSKLKKYFDFTGKAFIATIHYAGLFVIGAVILWAAGLEVFGVITEGHPDVSNVLMLFIYLELVAMVGIYFKTNHLPLRFLIYVGITAMTRHLIGVIAEDGFDYPLILTYCGGILILCMSVFLVRYASYKFPSDKKDIEEEN